MPVIRPLSCARTGERHRHSQRLRTAAPIDTGTRDYITHLMATDDHPTYPEPNRSSPDDRTLLETIAETEPTTIPELADGLGVHPATIERRCLELQRRGLVRQCTGGHLTVADSTGDERSNANASLTPDGGSSEPVAGD